MNGASLIPNAFVNPAAEADADLDKRLRAAVEAISLMCEGLNEHPLVILGALGETIDKLLNSCQDTALRCQFRRHVFKTMRETARISERRLGNVSGATPRYCDIVFDGDPLEEECMIEPSSEQDARRYLIVSDTIRIPLGDGWEQEP